MSTLNIVVVADTRTGSTVFCETLASELGFEYFGEKLLDVVSDDSISRRIEAFDVAISEIRNSSRTIFKVMYHDLFLLQPSRAKLGGTPIVVQSIIRSLPSVRLLHLTRRNTLEAAYSEFRATSLRKYHSEVGDSTTSETAPNISDQQLSEIISNSRERRAAISFVQDLLADTGGSFIGQIDYSDLITGTVIGRLQAMNISIQSWRPLYKKLVSADEYKCFISRIRAE